MASTTPCSIVLIEDNPADVMLLREALSTHAACTFTVFENGDHAIAFFEEMARAAATRPALIVLDLNLPGRDGVEVLGFIRGNPYLKDLAVAVVSTSPKDLMQRKTAQAHCYFTKPSHLEQFIALGKDLLRCIPAFGQE